MKSRIPKFGEGPHAPSVPKDKQLFKCPTCGQFRRMTDKVGYACTTCVATPGDLRKVNGSEE